MSGDFCLKCGGSWAGAGDCLACRDLAKGLVQFYSGTATWSKTYMSPSNHSLRIHPHPDLKKVAETDYDEGTDKYLSVYLDSNGTMNERKGVAIAANQTGRTGRWWVMKVPGGSEVIANATIDLLGPFKLMDEGCLSFPGQYAKVKRSERVRVSGIRLDLDTLVSSEFGEIWEGQDAQVAQHENDHLNGKCFIDHLGSAERSRIKGELARLKKMNLVMPWLQG